MELYFVTGNQGKLHELQQIVPHIQGTELDLPEIQHIDPYEVVREKLHAVEMEGSYIVEDTSLVIHALNRLPGPFIKWFLKTVGVDGIYRMTESFGIFEARAQTIIGLKLETGETYTFAGTLEGTIVEPRGENGFGWDSLFCPEGYDKTFAEMTSEEKNTLSMRSQAGHELAEFLKEYNE
ncbi:MAG: non-canonical purine NTP pyrophosphatase [Candidatus Paceibacteria bacterium]